MKVFTKRYFGKIPLGFWVRKSICTTWTYRVNRGNGFYGTKLGERIQLRYRYMPSDPHADNVGIENKNRFAAAVAAWQDLSDENKSWWNNEAKRLRLNMSGYNLFISRFEYEEPEDEVISGMILMWHGTIATIPAGYVLCDGHTGTPNLKDKFIVGAWQDEEGVAKTWIEGWIAQTGGSLTHDHGFTGDGHYHSFTGEGHYHSYGYQLNVDAGYEYYAWDSEYESSQESAYGYTDYEYAHGTTDERDNVPPYYALAFIMKT